MDHQSGTGTCFNNAWSVELPVHEAVTIISTTAQSSAVFSPAGAEEEAAREEVEEGGNVVVEFALHCNCTENCEATFFNSSSTACPPSRNIMARRGGSCAKVQFLPLHHLDAPPTHSLPGAREEWRVLCEMLNY